VVLRCKAVLAWSSRNRFAVGIAIGSPSLALIICWLWHRPPSTHPGGSVGNNCGQIGSNMPRPIGLANIKYLAGTRRPAAGSDGKALKSDSRVGVPRRRFQPRHGIRKPGRGRRVMSI